MLLLIHKTEWLLPCIVTFVTMFSFNFDLFFSYEQLCELVIFQHSLGGKENYLLLLHKQVKSGKEQLGTTYSILKCY